MPGGRPETESFERRGYLAFRRLRDAALAPAAAGLAACGVPSWTLSALSVALAATLFWSLPAHPAWALAAIGLSQAADMLDGAVARRAGTASGRGKLLDQACDAAAFAALALAAGARSLAPAGLALVAAVACTLSVAAALAHAARRGPDAFRSNPRAGLAAHLPKLPVFLALPTVLAGGPDLLAPALVTAAAAATAVTFAYLLGEGVGVLRAASTRSAAAAERGRPPST